MSIAEVSLKENNRIEVLRKYNILDSPVNGSFDRITRLAASIFRVPIAIISLVDTERIWFKSHHGLPISQIEREPGLCSSAILSNDPYIVENAIEDPRTLANPLVAGEFGLRFYAAAPLQTEGNFNLGTLCIIDKAPRKFTEEETVTLQELAAIVMEEMDLRLALKKTVSKLQRLTSDISCHLSDTIENVKTAALETESNRLLTYLDASRVFIGNVENELDNL